jgi:adenylate cyclase
MLGERTVGLRNSRLSQGVSSYAERVTRSRTGVKAEVTVAGVVCGTCGAEPSRIGARFCDACGAPFTASHRPAEFKQVTVLFADVVHSMDIAAAVGAERLREMMTELVTRASAVVQRFGGTVDKFTGDGIMAVFGAPVALEDHAFRACVAALEVQQVVEQLAAEIEPADGVALRLRIGMNSGQVIVGDIGSAALGYTAIGEQVGMAQRMESVAQPGGVMLSESSARLVDDLVVLGDPELLHVKGFDAAMPVRRLLGVRARRGLAPRAESPLVGRRWEMAAATGILDRSIEGHGGVVGVVGPPGIGKSRVVREVAAVATGRGVDVFWSFCESHASDIPFHVVTRLLRAVFGVDGLDRAAARERVRSRVTDADEQDLVLLDDLLGIGDPDTAVAAIDPDARRRRLTALINAALLARTEPAVYVIEDAHWIDEVSESLVAGFLTVIAQTRSLVLITHRPEYRGALTRVVGAQTLALAPLSDSESSALLADLLGPDPSVGQLAAAIVARAGGNPFFAQELTWDLSDRGVLHGHRGAYVCRSDATEVSVPATLQATIAARIDRLDPLAKRTLSAAAVIGSRFGTDMLTTLGVEVSLEELLAAELIDQVRFTRGAEYVFHHPLIRTVAYEAQLNSDRAELHRRLAAAIESGDPAAAEANAALIAEHLEAAGDVHDAYSWHLRAAAWSTSRDLAAARVSWLRAQQIADRLPADDADRASMRITPRTLLYGTAWRKGGSADDAAFEELRELTLAAGDQVSLAIAMGGRVSTLITHARIAEASLLASELTALLESIGDPTLTVGLLYVAGAAKLFAADLAEAVRLCQRVVDLAAGDPTKGALILGSPLAVALTVRGSARGGLGMPGWKDDFKEAAVMASEHDPTAQALLALYQYGAVTTGGSLADAAALHETAELLETAQRSGDNYTVSSAQYVRGIVLAHQDGPHRREGLELLIRARDAALREGFMLVQIPTIDTYLAQDKANSGDLDGAINLTRQVLDELVESRIHFNCAFPTSVLVEALLARGADGDLRQAQAAIDRLAEVPIEPGFVLNELPLLRLRALLARGHGDEAGYRDYADRYREMAHATGFEGHMAIAEAMT